ncbi:MaoC/PaaZ C-terminal domain-containing protein [Lentzea sp. NPDC003310]|uniref:MaoC/PaaZ C-terminal domain-containing protein n=1 Tax=Lentzea sp. NPDC003310 TaxID=3154447 RepID=UPI0033A56155
MLAKPDGGRLREGPQWAYEYKLDGYRAAMRIAADGTTVLTSRNGLDLTAEFAELTGVLTAALRGRAAVLDGEVVVYNEAGQIDFGLLQQRRARFTQDRVNLFAEATDDHQCIHTDPERARTGPFGGTIAHGYLTLALAPKFLYETVEIEVLQAGVNYGLNKVRFPAPVPVGSAVRARVRLLDARERAGGVEATFGITVEVPDSDRPVCVAEAVVLYR